MDNETGRWERSSCKNGKVCGLLRFLQENHTGLVGNGETKNSETT